MAKFGIKIHEIVYALAIGRMILFSFLCVSVCALHIFNFELFLQELKLNYCLPLQHTAYERNDSPKSHHRKKMRRSSKNCVKDEMLVNGFGWLQVTVMHAAM